MQRPSQPQPGLTEIIEELIDKDPSAVRVRCGVPHPLSNFAGPNFVDGLFADIILDFIHDTVWEEPESNAHKGAIWFLLESEQAYYFACAEAGIDAERLRNHLRKKLRCYDPEYPESGRFPQVSTIDSPRYIP